MFKIEDLMSGNFSSYPEEVQEFMKKYTEKLRENIIDELINDIADKMPKNIDESKEYFMNILTDILNKGYKGYCKMSTQALVNMYLERKNQEDFFRLMEKVDEQLGE